ncbi:HET domain protein [Truncatella angustata]|uniref:HET domain protein n=1 Tax=Truncatella angustata TaxID=152316 RepID=A0A9P8ZXC4_9PEZI|nr:HET domain protein [Truncatella angustata]KAH6653958.1 HET domain protein [Truncatella angustata]
MAPDIYEALPPPNSLGQTILATRLLMLAPGTGDQPLEGSLAYLDLTDSTIRYEALSYMWGTDKAPNPLRCQSSDIPITLNLETALRSLRLRDGIRTLWVDAVCINQNDLAERERQVGYMRLVYSQADRVIVWLGPSNDLNRAAIARAKELCQYRILLMDTHREDAQEMLSVYSGSQVEKTMLDAVIADSKRESGTALIKLFDNRYFRRVWCVQEVVASRQAVAKSGHDEIDFFDLLSLVKYIGALKHSEGLPAWPPSTLSFWGFIRSQRGRVYWPHSDLVENSLGDMLLILREIRNFESTDARDRIFAVLGITDQGIHSTGWASMEPPRSRVEKFLAWIAKKLDGRGSNIELWRNPAMAPNYTKSALEVYRDFTRYCLSRPPCVLDVLFHVQHTDDPRSTSFPSWVPKFDIPSSTNYFTYQVYQAGTLYRGRISESARLHDFPADGVNPLRPNVLQLEGFVFDHVLTITDTIMLDSNDAKPLDRVWEQLFHSSPRHKRNSTYIDGCTSLEVAFLMTLHAGALGSAVRYASFQRSVDALTQHAKNCLAHWLSHIRRVPLSTYQHIIKPVDIPAELPPIVAKSFMTTIRATSANRKLYRTSTGYLGLGPAATKSGDIVVVLLGGHLPFILRPSGTDWLLIGETYVHHPNLMMGSLLEPLHSKTRSQQPITFRII